MSKASAMEFMVAESIRFPFSAFRTVRVEQLTAKARSSCVQPFDNRSFLIKAGSGSIPRLRSFATSSPLLIEGRSTKIIVLNWEFLNFADQKDTGKLNRTSDPWHDPRDIRFVFSNQENKTTSVIVWQFATAT